MRSDLHLVSHPLCPYVQRTLIVAMEKGLSVRRTDIDLADKPAWFTALSPTGKTPLLQVTTPDDVTHVLFESAAIAEYLDEISPPALLPADPLVRAKSRGWIDYASSTLALIAGLYGSPDEADFRRRVDVLRAQFGRLEESIGLPWFSGASFGLTDAAFAPVFRYLDAFETLADLHLVPGLLRVAAWRDALAARPSVKAAVRPDYHSRLADFLRARGTHLSERIAARSMTLQSGPGA